MLMKNFNGIIGNWNRDLPACSAVPQPSAPSRVPWQQSFYIFSALEQIRLLQALFIYLVCRVIEILEENLQLNRHFLV
jgi:hypothetical protein